MKNPFLTYGYHGPEYFCDRAEETKRLTSLLVNGNHVALMSPRRMGKTGLIYHCFAQQELQENYYLFIVDIYATKSLAELTYQLGRSILSVLKSKGRKNWERFIQIAGSLRTGITLDALGQPSWNLEIGDIQTPNISLDEIFQYLREHFPLSPQRTHHIHFSTADSPQSYKPAMSRRNTSRSSPDKPDKKC